MAFLNVFKLGFKVDNDCGLMVEGGGLALKEGGMAPRVRRRKPGGGGARLGRSA
jgi:hypothetical protein